MCMQTVVTLQTILSPLYIGREQTIDAVPRDTHTESEKRGCINYW